MVSLEKSVLKKHRFKLHTDEDLIILTAWANGHDVELALDTAASHTVIDLNALMLLGIYPKDAIGTERVETSNGAITIQKYQLDSLTFLGRTVAPFQVMGYDFLQKGIISPYDGILGLDFLKQTILTIDFIKSEVWLNA